MEYNHDRVKANGKLHYQKNTGNSILVTLITMFLGGAIGGVIGGVFSFIMQIIIGISGGISAATENEAFLVIGVVFAFVMYIAVMIVVSVFPTLLSMGGMNWFRRSIYEEKLSIGVVFDVVSKNLKSNISMCLLRMLYIFLWGLLFYVPGIVKYYAYSQADYVKMEFPEVSASRAIEISKTMTMGYKGKLFYLDMSFLGWAILSVMTMNILGILYVFPYMQASKAFAYEELKAIAIERGTVPEFRQATVTAATY